MGAAPWAGIKSPWEVPQPRELGCSLTEAGISPQVPLLLFHFQVRKAIKRIGRLLLFPVPSS